MKGRHGHAASMTEPCRGPVAAVVVCMTALLLAACGQVEPLQSETDQPDISTSGLVDAVAGPTDATTTGLWSLASQGCEGRPDGAACEDGDPCTQDDHCKADVCVAGKEVCECRADGACAVYEDANLCNGKLYCDTLAFPYRCRIDPQSIVQCLGEAGPCVDNVCVASTGKCQSKPKAEGGVCDDGDACTVVSTCQKAQCVGEKASWCQCQGDSDCAGVGSGSPCDGSYFCDKSLFPYFCKINPGSVVSCSKVSNTACSKSACAPATGKCAMTPTEELVEVCPANLPCRWLAKAKGAVGKPAACDDGNPCTQGDLCAAGSCKSGDKDTCKCDKDADCADQEDGDYCNGVLYCDLKAGLCKVNPKTLIKCPTVDDSECTKNTCNPKTGTCALTPVLVGTGCDDGDKCTQGEICKAGKCAEGSNLCKCAKDSDCDGKDDGDLCNGTLVCDKQSGLCAHDPLSVVSCATVLDSDCTKNQCVPLSGDCTLTAVKDGLVCDDTQKCTVGEVCSKGKCTGGTDICTCKSTADCVAEDDGNLCNGTLFCNKSLALPKCEFNPATIVTCPTVGDTTCLKSQCVPVTGKCKLAPVGDGAPCDDGKACTKSDYCVLGGCKAGTNTCECESASDCLVKDDGNLCNGGFYCDKSNPAKPKCVFNAASKVTCVQPGGQPCLGAKCDPVSGECKVYPVGSGAACNDGSLCTEKDACMAGMCKGKPVSCDDDNKCTVDSCDPLKGCVAKKKNCGDGNACTVDACNPASGLCTLGQNQPDGAQCNADGNGCTINDACVQGACKVGVQVACPPTSQKCVETTCQSLLDGNNYKCSTVQKTNGTPCDDSDACVIGATCQQGACAKGTKNKFHLKVYKYGGNQTWLHGLTETKKGLVVVGARQVGHGKGKQKVGWIAGVDAVGALAWQVTATDKPHKENTFVEARADGDGSVWAAGQFSRVATGVCSNGPCKPGESWARTLDVKLLRIASGGKILSQSIFKVDSGVSNERVGAFDREPGGAMLLLANVETPGKDKSHTLWRLDSSGSSSKVVWKVSSKNDPKPASAANAYKWLYVKDARFMSDGGVVIAGVTALLQNNHKEVRVRRYDAAGKLLWEDERGNWVDKGLSAAASVAGGGVLAAGWRVDTASKSKQMQLHRYSSAGGLLWIRSHALFDEPMDMDVSKSGLTAVVGRSNPTGKNNDISLAVYDSLGNKQWSRLYLPFDDTPHRIKLLSDGGIAVVGVRVNNGASRGFLLRTDPWGNRNCASSGVCGATSWSKCDDGAACTLDVCDSFGGCKHPSALTGVCKPGNPCSSSGSCVKGQCTASANGKLFVRSYPNLGDFSDVTRVAAAIKTPTGFAVYLQRPGWKPSIYGSLSPKGTVLTVVPWSACGGGAVTGTAGRTYSEAKIMATTVTDKQKKIATFCRQAPDNPSKPTKIVTAWTVSLDGGCKSPPPQSPKSCVGRCNKYVQGAACQCDAGCKKYKDCCVDYGGVCVNPSPGCVTEGRAAFEAVDGTAFVVAMRKEKLGDVVVARVDAKGAKLWTKQFGKPDADEQPWGAVESSAGGVVVAGSEASGNAPSKGMVMGIDSNGTVVWKSAVNAVGGITGNGVILRTLAQAKDGSLYAAGFVFVNNWVYKRIVARLDSTGKTLWVISPVIADMSKAQASLAEDNGDLVLGGTGRVGADTVALLARYSAAGTLLWERKYAGGKYLDINPGVLFKVAAGGYFAAGQVQSTEKLLEKQKELVVLRANSWGHANCAASGECASKVEQDCDDGNTCTADLCTPGKGCQHKAVTGLACGKGKTCKAGLCQ